MYVIWNEGKTELERTAILKLSLYCNCSIHTAHTLFVFNGAIGREKQMQAHTSLETLFKKCHH